MSNQAQLTSAAERILSARAELAAERIARQRAETRLADCQRQLAELRRERDWNDSGLHWSADDGPDLNKVIC